MARKKGSKNLRYEVVFEVPPLCPRCGSRRLLAQPNPLIREQKYEGTQNGIPFTTSRWIKKRCGDCGQGITVVQRLAERIQQVNNDLPK
jgi:ribosomal protein S27AE